VNVYEEDARGRQANELLENSMFREAVDTLRQSLVDKWLASPIRDIEGQHELRLMAKLLGDIEGYIANIAKTGKMAAIQLERESKVAELKKYGIR
jgi:ABC-type siderophore export system fused ATPase/permease subunit